MNAPANRQGSTALEPLVTRHTAPTRRARRALEGSARATLFTAVSLLGAGCGVGTAAAVLGLDSNTTTEQIRVLTDDSMPLMSLDALAEPALEGRFPANDPRSLYMEATPTDALQIFLSKEAMASTVNTSNVRVEVRRPTPAGAPVIFTPVAVRDLRLSGSGRRIDIDLEGVTQLDGLYRVQMSGIRDAQGATQIPTTTGHFVTRIGSWSQTELVAFGQDVFGAGVLLSDDLDAYSVVEAQFVNAANEKTWTSSLLSGRFGGPWLSPNLVWQSPQSINQDEYQTNTGRLDFSALVSSFVIQEGNINNAPNVNIRVRVPTGIRDVGGALDFGNPVNGAVGGSEGIVDIGDAAMSPLLLNDHLSYAAHVDTSDSFASSPAQLDQARLVSAWWALTEPSLTYASEGVYGNELVIDVDRNVPNDWSARDWGGARKLSTGTHASWPRLVHRADGSTVAVWWTASTVSALLSSDLGASGRYEFAIYDAPSVPNATWQPTVQVAASTGTLFPITDVEPLSDGRLVVFSQGGGAGPQAQILDLTTGTLSAASSPSGMSFSMFLSYFPNLNDPRNNTNANAYGAWRGLTQSSTPHASSIGNDEFVVNWLDDVAPNQDLFLGVFAYDPQTGATSWRDVINVQSTLAMTSDVAVTVDPLGWATLLTLEAGASSIETTIQARRTNILVSGFASLATATPQNITADMPGTFQTFPGLSNTHSSGAVAAYWNFGIGPISGSNLRGSVMARYR